MIHRIAFQNYKAFQKGEIDVKPLTLLLGANSVGKSSILQLFLLLQQTAANKLNYKSALRLHGGYLNVGSPQNMISGKDLSKKITYHVSLTNSDERAISMSWSQRFSDEIVQTAMILSDFLENESESGFYNSLKKIFSNPKEGYFKRHTDYYRMISEKESFLELIEIIDRLAGSMEDMEAGKRSGWIAHRLERMPFNHIQAIRKRKEEYMLAYDLMHAFTKHTKPGSVYGLKYKLAASDRDLFIDTVSLYLDDLPLLEFTFHQIDGNLLSVSSQYFGKTLSGENETKDLRPYLTGQATMLSFARPYPPRESDENAPSFLARSILAVACSFTDLLKNELQTRGINYVGPLRAHPRRYYFLDKARINQSIDTLDGDAIAEVLKDDTTLNSKVNKWLERFDARISVSHMREVIHTLTVTQQNMPLDITDVGFGISQIVPVIIQGFLTQKNSITLIEQPEVHLHPKMQADLADLFVDMVKKDGEAEEGRRYLIVETHSEYLLRRLRRRIAEGTMSHEDVAIYFVEPRTKHRHAELKLLNVAETGFFEWPKDFYSGELLNDTFEYMKAVSKKD